MSEWWRIDCGGDVVEVEVVVSGLEKMKGLLGRDGLEPGKGFLIPRCSSIHTAFMRFSIDVVYLDDDMKVCKMREGMKPFRLSSCFGAAMVLELAAGEVCRLGMSVGSKLEKLQVNGIT